MMTEREYISECVQRASDFFLINEGEEYRISKKGVRILKELYLRISQSNVEPDPSVGAQGLIGLHYKTLN